MHETRWGVCVSRDDLFGAFSVRVIAPHLPTSVGAAEGHHRARVRMGGADREDGADEVYANGIALDVVRGWLGASASDLDWDTFDDVDDVDATRARPERLGLGAKFLSHARAQQLGNVARKLGGAIARSAKRRRENGDSDSESEEAATHRRGKNAGATGKKKGLPMGGAGGSNTGASGPPKDASDSESDSDEGGRAAAFTKGAARNKKRAQPAVWDPTKDVKCVGNAPGAGTSKKARKKAARRLREAEAAAARGGKSVA